VPAVIGKPEAFVAAWREFFLTFFAKILLPKGANPDYFRRAPNHLLGWRNW
jgi:hypothetical protein